MDIDRNAWRSKLVKNHDENKTYILVKLSESFSNAIQEYSTPTIKFQGSHGAIKFPSGKNYDFSLEQQDREVECIRQTENRWESVGKVACCLHVKGKDDVYQRTRTKMAAAEKEKRKYCTKLLGSPEHDSSNPSIASIGGSNNSMISATSSSGVHTKSNRINSNNHHHGHNNHNNHIAQTNSKTHHSNHHTSGTNNQHHMNHQLNQTNNRVTSIKGSGSSNSSNSNNSCYINSSTAEPRSSSSLLSSSSSSSSSSASSSSSSAPASTSTTTTTTINNNINNSTSNNNIILSKYPDIKDVEQLKKYKADFDKDFQEYQHLHGYLHRIEERFRNLRDTLRQSVEGSSEWESAKDQIFNEYDRVKGDSNFHRARSKYKQLYDKLAHIKGKIFQFKRDHGDKCNNRKKRKR